uniref:Uncharacterized protein n=1 Tax=Glossina pallidipes TaxID=7398 RepID=A0A1A9ZMQ1_GLOPL
MLLIHVRTGKQQINATPMKISTCNDLCVYNGLNEQFTNCAGVHMSKGHHIFRSKHNPDDINIRESKERKFCENL